MIRPKLVEAEVKYLYSDTTPIEVCDYSEVSDNVVSEVS